MALLQNMETKGVANVSEVLMKSFETLDSFQNESFQTNRYNSASRAIMILTDGVLGDHVQTFEFAKKSFSRNGVVQSTRIFTYLIGKDLKNAAPLGSIACNQKKRVATWYQFSVENQFPRPDFRQNEFSTTKNLASVLSFSQLKSSTKIVRTF